jgi:hypothetical protein
MKRDSLCDFLMFLDFTVGTGDVIGVGVDGMVILFDSEGTAKFLDFAGGFVNADDVACKDILVAQCFDHFRSQVVGCAHICCLDRQFPLIGSLVIKAVQKEGDVQQ